MHRVEERMARLVGGPADGERRMVSADTDGSWPVQVRSTPTGDGPDADRSYTYELTPSATGEGDLVYELMAEQPSQRAE
jgi:hypothetical protein